MYELNRITYLTLVMILSNTVQCAQLVVLREDYFNEIIESARVRWTVDAGRI